MCKIVLTQNHKLGNFNATDLLYIFIEDRENASKLDLEGEPAEL